MGFPHCPICVAVAFLTACITVTRGYFLLLLCMHFSYELSRMENRIRTLVEEIALLKEKLEKEN